MLLAPCRYRSASSFCLFSEKPSVKLHNRYFDTKRRLHKQTNKQKHTSAYLDTKTASCNFCWNKAHVQRLENWMFKLMAVCEP